MAQDPILRAAGLYTQPNRLSELPDGALVRADNYVINRDGIIQPRRGRNWAGVDIGAGDDTSRVRAMAEYAGKLIVNTNDGYLAIGALPLASTSNLTGTFSPPSGYRMRFAEAQRGLFFTTSAGPMWLESAATTTPVAAGVPQTPDMVEESSGPASLSGPNYLANDYAARYRAVVGYVDANGRLILGAPSGPMLVTNTSGSSKDAVVVVRLPVGITTAHIVQLYRSRSRDTAAGVPDEELQLVFEANPSSSDVSFRAITISDITPDDLRGAAAYWNASQLDGGLARANTQPPLARDIAAFAGSMFYAHTTQRQRLLIRLLSADATNGIQPGDTVTIAGVTYNGIASGAPKTADDFEIFGTWGTGTPAQNIEGTALSLVQAINTPSNNSPVDAFYVSGPDDPPGQILLVHRTLGNVAFTAASSNGDVWTPDLTVAESSSDDAAPNRLYWSKPGQPEAVPLGYYADVGSRDKAILRIVPLRESLFILKEDGIWRLIGDSPETFRVLEVDLTVRLLAPETAQPLANRLLALTDQGVVAVSDTGVAILSRPIEADLVELIRTAENGASSAITQYAFAVAYETDRSYLLWLPSSSISTQGDFAYVYNIATQAWTKRGDAALCGLVTKTTGRLHLGAVNDDDVLVERKALTKADFADEGGTVEITAIDGNVWTLTSTSGLSVGDVLVWEDGEFMAWVTALNLFPAHSITVDADRDPELGVIDYWKRISCVLRWPVRTGGEPNAMKHFRELCLFTRDPDFTEITLGFLVEGSGGVEETVTVEGPGQTVTDEGDPSYAMRTTIPYGVARANQLRLSITHARACEQFILEGLSVVFNAYGERARR